ncbi:Ankyrin repeat domain-containing protein [Plasmodiophora brassicae]
MSVGNRIPSLATASAACLLLIVGVVDVAVLATSSSGDDLGYETASTRSDDWSAIASSRGKSVPEEHYYHSAPGMVRLRELANTHAKMKIVAKLHDCLLTGKGNVAFVNDVKPHWDERMTLLQWAAYHGEADVVKFLLSVPGMRLNTQGYLGRTALHWASFRGRNDVVSSLLQAHGIDVDARDAQQQTPLHLAMMNQQFKVIQLLLDVDGISVNAMDWDRKTPLQYALERWQGPSPSRSLRRTIQKLIRVGAGVGTTEMSPLYWAVV